MVFFFSNLAILLLLPDILVVFISGMLVFHKMVLKCMCLCTTQQSACTTGSSLTVGLGKGLDGKKIYVLYDKLEREENKFHIIVLKGEFLSVIQT